MKRPSLLQALPPIRILKKYIAAKLDIGVEKNEFQSTHRLMNSELSVSWATGIV